MNEDAYLDSYMEDYISAGYANPSYHNEWTGPWTYLDDPYHEDRDDDYYFDEDDDYDWREDQ